MALVEALTIDDFERLPYALAKNHELVDGELVDVSGNTGEHNALRGYIEAVLRQHVAARKSGRVLAEQEYAFGSNVHGPDVSFFGTAKFGLYDPKLRVQRFVPDLAIEIASENDRFNSLVKKVTRYIDCGTAEAWVFTIENRKAYRLTAGGETVLRENDDVSSALLPGFSIRLADLFDNA